MPINRLYVAMWNVNTTNLPATIYLTKFHSLRSRVRSAYESIAAYDGERPDSLYAFVAPEYLFQSGPTQRFYERDFRNGFLDDMGPVTLAAPKMLIIPGTFCWREPKPVMMGQQAPHGPTHYYGYNTAFVFYGERGRFPYFQYHKSQNAGEVLADDHNTEFKLSASRGIFGLEDRDFGIEVCRDTYDTVLSGTLGDQQVDAQFLLSQGADHRFTDHALAQRVRVRDGGYFIHCDGTSDDSPRVYNGVWQLARGAGSHGTASFVQQHVDAANSETEYARLRGLGFAVQRGDPAEDGSRILTYYEMAGKVPSPVGHPGNVNMIQPIPMDLGDGIDDVLVYEAPL